MPYGILIDSAAIAGVAFNGVNNSIVNFPDNVRMVGLPVLRTRRTFVIPIKEDNHFGDNLGLAYLCTEQDKRESNSYVEKKEDFFR